MHRNQSWENRILLAGGIELYVEEDGRCLFESPGDPRG